jgi:alkylation response protein AidB-like acyl-CoA dehydrogenase
MNHYAAPLRDMRFVLEEQQRHRALELPGFENAGAVGYLVGEPGRGLNHMFTMMNAARHKVGVQGIGVAERACQHAFAYARERTQGRPHPSAGRRRMHD